MPPLYKLSDAALKKRAEDGDEEAEIILQDREIVRGLVAKDPTYTDQHWTWLGTQLCLHFRRSAVPPCRVGLALRITESITAEFLELHWSEVRTWHKFLLDLQGAEPSNCESPSRDGKLSVDRDEPPPWLRLDQYKEQRPYACILVNDTLRIPEIKRYWTWVRSWHRFLREEYGPSPYSSDGFLKRLNNLHENGRSYTQIARLVEEEACSMLERRMYRLRGSSLDELVNDDEWTADEVKHWLDECSAGLYGLNVLGCSRSDVSDWLRRTLRSIGIKAMASLKQANSDDRSRLSPMDFVLNREAIDPVVDREKVIHALRKFNNRGKKGLSVRQNKKT